MTATNPKLEYLKAAVLTASQEQLHLMLLDGAIRFVTTAREAIEAKQIEAAYNALDRAQRIIQELDGGMRREANPELVDRTRSLYAFIFRRLIDAGITRDLKAVDDALKILRAQRETWTLLMEKIATISARSGMEKPAAASATSRPGATDEGPRTTISIEG